MQNDPTPIPALDGQLALEIARRLDLPEPALGILVGGDPPSVFARRLLEAGLGDEAVRVVAASLPRAAAVRWATRCVRSAHVDDLSSSEALALEAAEAWVLRPSEEKRRAAWEAGERLGFGSSAAWACAAAFWHGGSITPAGQPEVEVPEHLLERAVTGAVRLAAAEGEPAEVARRVRSYVEDGLELARELPVGAS